MNWIKCEDQLPNNEKHVVVLIKNEHRPKIGFYMDDGWIVTSFGEDTPGEMFYSDEDITHWMPLPNPPTDGSE